MSLNDVDYRLEDDVTMSHLTHPKQDDVTFRVYTHKGKLAIQLRYHTKCLTRYVSRNETLDIIRELIIRLPEE